MLGVLLEIMQHNRNISDLRSRVFICSFLAFNATYYLAKTEITKEEVHAEEDYFVAALEWGVDHQVDIITASLGYPDWYWKYFMEFSTLCSYSFFYKVQFYTVGW
jgi:hypothetical protein